MSDPIAPPLRPMLTGHVVSAQIRRYEVELLYGDGRIVVIKAASAAGEPEIRVSEPK